ncbi:DUF6531 domain-containing protein [Pseudomonas amygdali]|uniref:DUF6531 domain-containing protein n=1 Tax=Pseudomonas amygdali pv. morsprunorum TaxID=129138 RepID=A0AB35R7R1_PSEA0|nr:DUF6531 domain-containing protein [Pseudomonas amygdali]MDT3227576.1 DUF6531 domain-containing protein [Pseudomonas amygdali pv. morsprunorum]MDT3243725.1 DUF6531 domain-containing protein [Pseudomonas amygdali pv. morsprunorum]MDT3264933.1 DUF6531 domain-containing protein [Pseudomonas amygdali pv. morsprunorum]
MNKKVKNNRAKVFLLLIFFFSLTPAQAQQFSFWTSNWYVVFDNPSQVCELTYSMHPDLIYKPELNRYNGKIGDVELYACGGNDGIRDIFFGGSSHMVIDCKPGSSLDHSTGKCKETAQKGKPLEPLLCRNPSSEVGNPINSANGNKFQHEHDLSVGVLSPILIDRFYNSFDGLWRHSYSSSLYFGSESVVLIHDDGREAVFYMVNGSYKSDTDSGILTELQQSGWRYTDPSNNVLFFSEDGRLVKTTASNGGEYNLAYAAAGFDRSVVISNTMGESIQFMETPLRQLRFVAVNNLRIDYKYNMHNRLIEVVKTENSASLSRKYYYEDERNTGWLTGISDERGVRFATWAYDGQGRSTMSQHAGGASLIQINYNADGSSTVTNELGKKTVYRYKNISGVKRISSIEGEPSANCPASNSVYTYNDRGQVLTKTDAKGLVTTYDYNDRGLEVSRTEATGTALARPTTTEWDPDRFLPIKVIEPNRITVYSYDNQGRELTRQSTSR